jgi:hypothetical protein
MLLNCHNLNHARCERLPTRLLYEGFIGVKVVTSPSMFRPIVVCFANYHRGSTRFQVGSTCFRISASSSRLRNGTLSYRSRPRASWS